MNIEAIVFLIIIGIIVILTITEKNDPLDKGVIDFKESHDINGDIKKLKARIKDDAKAARDTKKLLISLIVIIVVILTGFVLVSYDLIFNKVKEDIIIDNKEDDNEKEKDNDTKEDYDKDKDDKEDKNDISLESLGEVSDYIKEAQKADDCDKESIVKTAEYHKDKIENNLLELYLVKDNKYVSVKASDNLNKLLDSYFRSQSYEKLFVIDGDGNLTKYIFICK